LSRPDVDPTRVGYVGHSFGGTMGAILAHVEPRVKAFILIGTGASLTREILESPGMAGLRAHVPKSALDAYAAAMGPFDAERHLAEAAPTAHVFFQFGSFDEVVDASEASKSVAACRAVTETRTYPTGHFVTSPAAARDRLAFFARELLLPRAGDAMNRELGS
jgi:pimeloyl-ACP methyl ester carboxylesterase